MSDITFNILTSRKEKLKKKAMKCAFRDSFQNFLPRLWNILI